MTKQSYLCGQSNALIESVYRMDLDSKRLLLLGLTKISYKGKDRSAKAFTFSVTAAEWRAVYGDDSNGDSGNTYRQMRQAAENLMRTESACVFIPTRGWDSDEVHWFSRCRYREGQVEMIFDAEIRGYLTDLQSQYTPIDLKALGGLQSVYSVRIYEICRQYRSVGSREVMVEDLRQWLGLSGKYPLFSDFRRRVLEQAEREINQLHADANAVAADQARQDRQVYPLRYSGCSLMAEAGGFAASLVDGSTPYG